jgi:nucleotide-binding universal stress UspA family protein
MFKHILVPTDGSVLSATAVEKALTLARDVKAKVTVMTAIEPFHVLTTTPASLSDTRESYVKHARAEGERVLAEAQKKARELGVACAVAQVEADQPYKAIIEAAEKNGCDLIAMASHGRRGVAALVIGSETTKVLTHSAIPVLVYR